MFLWRPLDRLEPKQRRLLQVSYNPAASAEAGATPVSLSFHPVQVWETLLSWHDTN